MKKYIYLIYTVMLLSSCNGQTGSNTNSPIKDEIQRVSDQYAKEMAPALHQTGLSITTSCAGKEPITVTSGKVSLDSDLPIKSNNIFQIGSNTKSFTAVVLLQLTREYKFSLDDTVGKWFPEYPKWSAITIRQLLNMTSGIPEYVSDDLLLSWLNNPMQYTSPEQLIANVYEQPVNFNPGDKYEYSNSNYLLAGMLIKKITGNNIDVEIKNRIIDKLGLRNTYFPTDHPQDIAPLNQLVHGYFFSNDYVQRDARYKQYLGKDMTYASLSIPYAGGAIISTTKDMDKYFRVLYATNQLLNQNEFNQLTDVVSMRTGKHIGKPNATDNSGFGLGIQMGFDSDHILTNNGDDGLFYVYIGATLMFQTTHIYIPQYSSITTWSLNSGDQDDWLNNTMPFFKLIKNHLNQNCIVNK